jgi:stage III sporulation protein AD
MTEYIKIVSGVLLAVVLAICLGKQAKDWSMLLTVAVCCMVMAGAASFFEPILRFLEKLRDSANIDPEVLEILFKAVGIGLIGEFAGRICQDSGYGSMGKGIQVLTAGAVLWLALPMMESLLTLVGNVLEGL